MSDPSLTLLKYVFLAVLYLFFVRVLRAVWVEMREPRASALAVPPEAVAAQVPLPAAAASRLPGPATVHSAAGPERLVVVGPEAMEGQEFPLPGEATVGRAAGCAVLLTGDSFVSQIHARVFRSDGDIWVEDLGSTNGTFVNGRKVGAAVAVRPGDTIQFGRTTVELRR